MARARMIRPGFVTNEDLAECSAEARLFFICLWMVADRRGIVEDRPKRIKAELFPFDSFEIDDLLDELSSKHFVLRYEADGHKCLYIPNFVKHQRPHPKEPSNGLPDLPETFTASPRKVIASCAESIPSGPSESIPSGSCSEIASDSEPPAAVLEFPTVGDGNGSWPLTQQKLDEYAKAFPGLDPLSEARKALQWCRDNPRKRKTVRGMAPFLFRWMERAQNSIGGKSLAAGGASPAERLKRLKEKHL